MSRFPQVSQFSQVNHTPFPRMADFFHNWAKNTRYSHQKVKYVDSSNTLRLPDRKKTPTYFERPLPCHMPLTGIESGPQQLHARTQGCANYDFKVRMYPNYELSDAVHSFLGNILISKCKRGNFHTHIIQNETIIGKKFFMIAIVARGAYDSCPIYMSHNNTNM